MTPDDSPTLAKTFDPAAIEARWYAHWEDRGLFRPERPDAQPFTIVNPPPNVTGSLHIGHALDNTLQDVVVRYERLRGKDALWVVGTDHAGIATQMVVERELEKRQDKRTNYSREDFVAKVWEWKHASGGTITGQLRRLGCSMDWSREQFTMDPHFTKAVIKVFVDLYNQKLIYRDKRLVNWDPKLKTAISDLEVENREVQGHMWHFKYPLAGGETYTYVERDADDAVLFEEERDYIAIATTRPETMLGDGAVAVHPNDARYAPIVGKLCEIPVGPKEHRRLIPIITDSYPDPDFGSGAVKITGAHDENDYGVAQRNGIPMYRLMDEVAAMRSDGAPYAETAAKALAIARGEATATAAEIDALNLVPDEYRGLDRYVARERVIADIDAEGLMLGVEDKTIVQPFGDRGGVVIEPMLTDQWYVNAGELAKAPIAAVRSGAIEIVPKSWEKTFFNWMENIQPWCVSRQLWWGHRIPAWYCPMPSDQLAGIRIMDRNESGDQQYRLRTIHFVCETQDNALGQIAVEHGVSIDGLHVCESKDEYARHLIEGRDKIPVLQDQDVLDTWFSSALWPFATLGWPEDAEQQNTVRPELVEGPSFTSGVIAHTHEGKSGASTSSAQTGLGDAGAGNKGSSLLARHYPNDLLISGFDILFFWDARMAMQGMHFMGEPPWKRLYLHGLVRAPDGQKMSKSKGNVVDPLILIDKFGADALRFFMAAMESQGRDIKMDERRVEGYRNFATKLWNAARFCQSNGIAASATLAAPAAKSAVNRWIIGEVVETVAALDQAMADLRFDAAANAIYHFVWDTFCDWYIELIKGSFDDETKAVAGWVLDQILVMLHPFMPFVTEELWHAMGARPCELIVAKWPEPGSVVDVEAKREVELVISVIDGIRSQRLEVGFKPGDVVPTSILAASDDALAIVNGNLSSIRRIARIQPALISISKYEGGDAWGTEPLDQFQINDIETTSFVSVQFPVGEITFLGFTQGFIDTVAEKARLEKALAVSQKEAKSLEGRLSNPSFVEKAKPEAIAKARADHAHHAAEAERLAAALARLG